MKNKADIIECLKTTPIIQIACQKCGIGRSTYYNWLKEDESFKTESEQALKEGNAFINDLAESQLITLIKEKHPTSIYYWLNHKHPEYNETRLLLPLNEQKDLTDIIFSNEKLEVLYFIMTMIIQGKVSKTYSHKSILDIMKSYKTITNGWSGLD